MAKLFSAATAGETRLSPEGKTNQVEMGEAEVDIGAAVLSRPL